MQVLLCIERAAGNPPGLPAAYICFAVGQACGDQVNLSRCMQGVSQAVSFEGFGTGEMQPEWLFCEVCGMQALFLWPPLRCSCSRSGQLCSGYFAAGECYWQVSAKRKRKPNKAYNLLFRPDKEA